MASRFSDTINAFNRLIPGMAALQTAPFYKRILVAA